MINNLLSPKIDVVFKSLFGKPKNSRLTESMISAILKTRVNNIELDLNLNLMEEWPEQKLGILDVRAKLQDETNCNIEIQVADKNNIEKRILFYWSKLYAQQLEKAKKYNILNKTISILILNYEIKNLKEINKYHTIWKIREEEFMSKILIEDLEIHIIELPKFIKIKNRLDDKEDMLAKWLLFMENPEQEGVKEEMKKCEEIKEAVKELEYLSGNAKIRYLAELREKAILDENSNIEYAKEEGIQEGIKEGLKEGLKKGIKEIAKNMLSKNIDINIIIDVTGLSKEELEKLK